MPNFYFVIRYYYHSRKDHIFYPPIRFRKYNLKIIGFQSEYVQIHENITANIFPFSFSL